MKKIALILFAITIIACNNNKTEKKATTDTIEAKTEEKSTLPEINTLVKDTVDDNMMLLGKINRKGLEQKIFTEWYKENYYAHNLDSATIKSIEPKLKGITIKVFMGTWCSDSQREIPAIYNVLEAADFDFNNFEIIAVDHNKETPNHLEKDMDIQYVPTIIFYENGKEIGRFVESAQETLEKDMLAILNKNGYKHIYEE